MVEYLIPFWDLKTLFFPSYGLKSDSISHCGFESNQINHSVSWLNGFTCRPIRSWHVAT